MTFTVHVLLCMVKSYADIAQLAVQLICNQQVAGSIPVVSSIKHSLGVEGALWVYPMFGGKHNKPSVDSVTVNCSQSAYSL